LIPPLRAATVQAVTPTTTAAYRIYVLGLLVVVYTFNFLDRVIVAILAEPIKKDLGLTDTQLGLMSGAAFAIFYTFLGIPVARLADRMSRTTIMTIALALWSGFTALCGQAQTFMQLLLARIGVGVGEAGGVAPALSLVSDYFPPQQRARALAVLSFGIPIGTGLGTLLGGLVASAVDWRAAFLVVGLAGVALAPVLKLTVREPARGGLDVAQPAARVGHASFAEVLRLLARKPSFILLALGTSFASIVGYGIVFWSPSFFIRSHDLTLSQVAWFLGLGSLVFGVLGNSIGGWAGDRFGARSLGSLAVVPAIMIAAIIPFLASGVLVESFPLAFALYLVPIALASCWAGPVWSALQQIVAPHMRATTSAIWMFINNLIGIGGGTLIVGATSDYLAPRYGSDSLRYAILIVTGFYVASSACFVLAARHLQRDWHRA
jgi:predicted MFS family arabinose efflux permease